MAKKHITIALNKKLLVKALLADNFFDRFFGYMLKRKEKAIIFPDSQMIHMFFVYKPLGVVVLDKKFKLLDKFIIKPWQISKLFWKAKYIIEFSNTSLLKNLHEISLKS